MSRSIVYGFIYEYWLGLGGLIIVDRGCCRRRTDMIKQFIYSASCKFLDIYCVFSVGSCVICLWQRACDWCLMRQGCQRQGDFSQFPFQLLCVFFEFWIFKWAGYMVPCIPNGVLNDSQDDDTDIFGITTCNIPIGSEAFVNECLEQKSAKIRRGFDNISSLLDSGWWPHLKIPSHPMLWILTVAHCLQFMGDYWLRHSIRLNQTGEFAREIDDSINSLFQTRQGGDQHGWCVEQFCEGENTSNNQAQGMQLKGSGRSTLLPFLGCAALKDTAIDG